MRFSPKLNYCQKQCILIFYLYCYNFYVVLDLPAVPHIPAAYHVGIAPNQPRHYCCSIDLRSVKLTEIPHQCNVFLR